VRDDWPRKIEVHPVLNCNWLQPMENAVDPSHTRYLHGESFRRKGIRRDLSYILKKVDHFEYEPCEWGIRKRRVFEDGKKEIGHLLVMPNILRHPGSLHFRVPIDDTHTQIYRVIRMLDGRRPAATISMSNTLRTKTTKMSFMENSERMSRRETQRTIADKAETLGSPTRVRSFANCP
jgi:phenylpropionate dioxygenase-like ring-hydroxylating dioxygenase large terminal subunit